MVDPTPAQDAHKAMIISVGGAFEPIAASLREHRPACVIFFASQQSVEDIGALKHHLRELGITFENQNVIVPDAQDLPGAYRCALKAADWVLQHGFSPSQVVVDFTGGTKTMTAALTLATVGRGFTFSYVGGEQRTKEGKGVVVTGSETILREADPYQVFMVEERRQLAQYFASYQFTAAYTVAESLRQRLPDGPDRVSFTFVAKLARGYGAWDRFQYQEAIRVLKEASRSWILSVQANPSIPYAKVLPHLEAQVKWLADFQTKTRDFKRFHVLFVMDLMANAGRRAEEGQYDDAVIRLYRALEMGAQAIIQERLGCGSGKVPASRVPGNLRGEFVNRGYSKLQGMFELPLHASYQLLEALDVREGVEFLNSTSIFKRFNRHGTPVCLLMVYNPYLLMPTPR